MNKVIPIIEIDPNLIKELAAKGKRLDGRGFEAYRPAVITSGIITSAEGSARVQLGGTEVIVGVKMNIGEPFPDTPDEGVLIVMAEFLPLASPDFEPGPPNENAVELARVVDRAIRESKAIDMKKLCITPGEKVWMIYIDIDILDNDGNLIDAAGLGAAAALHDARIPEVVDDKPVYDEKGYHKLPMRGTPLSTTLAKVNGRILADPTLAEEMSADARLTVGSIKVDNHVLLCSIQKGKSTGLSLDDIEAMLSLAVAKGEELRDLLAHA